jgi:hypothetical protein
VVSSVWSCVCLFTRVCNVCMSCNSRPSLYLHVSHQGAFETRTVRSYCKMTSCDILLSPFRATPLKDRGLRGIANFDQQRACVAQNREAQRHAHRGCHASCRKFLRCVRNEDGFGERAKELIMIGDDGFFRGKSANVDRLMSCRRLGSLCSRRISIESCTDRCPATVGESDSEASAFPACLKGDIDTRLHRILRQQMRPFPDR